MTAAERVFHYRHNHPERDEHESSPSPVPSNDHGWEESEVPHDNGPVEPDAFEHIVDTHFGTHSINSLDLDHEGRGATIDGQPQELHHELDVEARTPLYEGAQTSRLAATLLLLNLQGVYNTSDSHTDSLFQLLNGKLLPQPNTLPPSHREAKKVLSSIGLEFQTIHACPGGCILYRGEHAGKTECPRRHCKKKRY